MKETGFIESRALPKQLELWLSRLACPECTGDLRLVASSLVCSKCKRNFQISFGVPILFPDALRNIPKDEEDRWLKVHTELEEKYVDLDGDSYRQKMLETARESFDSNTWDSFLWEKRLFVNLRKHLGLRKRLIGSLKERNQLILCKLRERFNLRDKIVLNVGPGSDADLVARLENEGAEVMNCDLIEDSLHYLAGESKELLTAGDIRSLPFPA